MRFDDLFTQLHDEAGYEEHLVRLVVGSLSTPNKAGCISVRYKNHSVGSRELELQNAGPLLSESSTQKY